MAYASIDGVRFLIWHHTFNMVVMTSAGRSCCICSSVRYPTEHVSTVPES